MSPSSILSLLVAASLGTSLAAAPQGGVGQDPAAVLVPVTEPDPVYDALHAHLAHRPADVAAALAKIPSPAARARLQAAFCPVDQRATALLAVAQRFPDDPEADLALLAGAAAAVVTMGRGEAANETMQWHERVDEDRYATARAKQALLSVVNALHGEVARRRAAGGDAKVLDEAAAMLAVASVSRPQLEPVWFERDDRFRAPQDLRESIAIAFHRRAPASIGVTAYQGDRLRWSELLDLGALVQSVTFEPRRAAVSPEIPYGHYLCTVRSQATPWWGVVPVEVSDLVAVAVNDEQTLVLATWCGTQPVRAQFELEGWHGQQQGDVDGRGAVIAFDERLGAGASWQLRLASEFGPARLHGSGPYDNALAGEERWRVHTMVERPVVRPGETIRGRLVLRETTRTGEGRARVPTTRAAPDRGVRVRLPFGAAGEALTVGRTDAHGVFAFEIEVPEIAPPTGGVAVLVDVLPQGAEEEVVELSGVRPFAVANFTRAATTIAGEGPELLPVRDGRRDRQEVVEVAAVVRYASGAPVAGQRVQAVCAGTETPLRTGTDGRASLRIDLAEWRAWRAASTSPEAREPDLRVVFRTIGPDGKTQQAEHVVLATKPEPARAVASPRRWRRDSDRIDVEPSVVGRATRLLLRGAPGARAMLVVGRSRNARVFPVHFDERGRAAQAVEVLRVDWPQLDVALVDRDGTEEDFATVTLGPVVAATVEVAATVAPGGELAARVRSGRPGALVTLAVVDERLFEIEADRTREPTGDLRPYAPFADWARMARAKRVDPADLLADVLVAGRVPALDLLTFVGGGAGAGGPAAGAAAAAPPVRADFRAVAHFETVLADESGLATFRVRMPSDLTTWRLTAAVVDANGEGVLARASTTTRVPWSVEPVLPRGVREGDAFELPLVVARAAEVAGEHKAEVAGAQAAANERVALHASVVGTGFEFAENSVATKVVAGRSQLVTLPVRAVAKGEATLALELRGIEVLDRSVRPLVVERDAVVRPVVAAQRGEGTVRIALPEGASPEEELVVDVMLGDAAVWRRLERDLAVYPYGCAEQTLSKLLPYFAAARAAKRRQQAVTAMDQDFRKRLRAGLGRLRQLRAGPAHFSFWPGGEADVEISVLVRHGLAVLREAGVDLAAEGLDVAGAFVVPTPLANDADESAQYVFALAIEQAAASLRLAPEATRARELMAVALPARADEPTAPRLPAPGLAAGAVARLGLALLAAGERDGARACLQHLDRRGPTGRGVVARAGDDPLAVAAMHFELRLALDGDAAAVQRALADLVFSCASFGGSTYGRACASAALALAVSPTARASADVVVEVAGQRREASLQHDRPEQGRLRFPRGGEVVVRGPEGVSLLVRVTGLRVQRGSDHAAWAVPIRVERALHALAGALDEGSLARALRQPLAPAAGAAADAGDGHSAVPEQGLPLAAGPLPAGRPVLLVVRATSPTALPHVVIECPLPCGFEPVGDTCGLERFDAHVAFVANLEAGVRYERRIVLVPTTVGRLLWPPVVAAPMYAAGLDGGTAGAFVEVVPPVLGVEPTIGDWSPRAAPKVEASATASPHEARTSHTATPVVDDEEALRVLFACWEREQESETVVPELAAQTMRALGFDRDTAEPVEQVLALHRWLEVARALARQRGGRQDLLAAAFGDWLRDLLLCALQDLVRQPVRSDRDDAASEIAAADAALDYVEDLHEQEFLRIGLLRRAAASAPDEVEGLLDRLPEHAENADNWPGLRALLVALLVHEDADVRRAAFDRLPRPARRTLPLAVTLRAYGTSWDEEFVRECLASERHAREFEQALHDPDVVFENLDVLRKWVPADWWLRQPLPVIERLAEVARPFATSDAWSIPQLGAIAARGIATDDELARAFARTEDEDVRDVLVRAMELRGVRTIGAPVRADDASFSLWQQALAVPAADVARSIELLHRLGAGDGELPMQDPGSSVACFLCARITAHGTPDEVYAIARALAAGDWAVAWQRFDAGQRVQLVDRFQHHLPDGFVPATEPEAEAIWRFLLRGGHVDAMRGLVATMPGVRIARRHIVAGDGGPRAAELRTAFAEALDYDEGTLQPAVEDAASVLLDSLQRWGRTAELTPNERTALARLRRHLGAAPPLR